LFKTNQAINKGKKRAESEIEKEDQKLKRAKN